MSVDVLVSVTACVSVCVALDYSLGPEIPDSQYGDDDLGKESELDTMEYMDDLKEKVDASITPLSEMDSMAISDDTTEEDSTTVTEIDPHDYIRLKTTQLPGYESSTIETTKKLPIKKRRGKIGRPRKTTALPMFRGEVVERTTKKRMRWDSGMNKFIMYTYFLVTKMETDMTQYRKKMREKFLEAYPEWDIITEQRLADQKRSIKQNRLVDIETIRDIKRKVKLELEEQGVFVNVVDDSRDKSFYD